MSLFALAHVVPTRVPMISSVSPAAKPVGQGTSTFGPVLVACDGAPAHDTIFTAARHAAEALAARVEVVGVCSPTVDVAAGAGILPPPVALDERRRLRFLADVERAVSIGGGDGSWPVEVRLGAPASTLAEHAAQQKASLLVMGLGRHSPLDRLFGTEVTLSTLRESRVPILAVGATFDAPRHVVVGTDFSACSIEAARLALKLIGETGRLTLIHVRPSLEQSTPDSQAWEAEYSRKLPPLFEDLRTKLDAPSGVHVETVTMRGDAPVALLAYVQQTGADMIAVGTQRHGLLERLIVGSVAARIMRTARCPVLAVPARALPIMPPPKAGD